MKLQMFEVVKPGMLTTIQDLGRYHYLNKGIVAAGAMDPFAAQVANCLVGNREDEAVLEITVLGPKLKVLNDGVVSLCGADLAPCLDDRSVVMWKSFSVKRGQMLSFRRALTGVRAYLAIQGGFAVPSVLGSRSTYIKGRIGGLHGREMQTGDRLDRNERKAELKHWRHIGLKRSLIPDYQSNAAIRIILGPDEANFTADAVETFLSNSYQVTEKCDRMGIRLAGPRLVHRVEVGADIYSDAVTFGTIQVPADGQPIVLMADRQTTGGYARLAHVIEVDLPLLAQKNVE